MKFVEKVWGSEKWIVNNDLYCGKLLKLNEMFMCCIHYHKKKTGTFYVLKGQVLLEVEDNAYILLPGDAIDILPNQDHRFTGMEDSEMIEFSTHHEDEDSYVKEPSCMIRTDQIEGFNKKIHLAKDNNEAVRRHPPG